jgi:hypothetical protein
MHHSLSRNVRLLGKEDVLLFHLCYRIGMPVHPLMTNDLALERHLAHLHQVRGDALKADDRIPRRHVAFKLPGLDSAMHP